jgi:hypothetical protein
MSSSIQAMIPQVAAPLIEKLVKQLKTYQAVIDFDH